MVTREGLFLSKLSVPRPVWQVVTALWYHFWEQKNLLIGTLILSKELGLNKALLLFQASLSFKLLHLFNSAWRRYGQERQQAESVLWEGLWRVERLTKTWQKYWRQRTTLWIPRAVRNPGSVEGDVLLGLEKVSRGQRFLRDYSHRVPHTSSRKGRHVPAACHLLGANGTNLEGTC